MIQAYHPYLEPLGITYPQYLILMLLWEQDNQLVNHIAHQLCLETNTVTPLIQRMEKEGLVRRRKGEADQRQTVVSLTRKGLLLEEQAKDVPTCLSDSIAMRGIQPEEMISLIAPLDHLIQALGRQDDPPHTSR